MEQWYRNSQLKSLLHLFEYEKEDWIEKKEDKNNINDFHIALQILKSFKIV